MITFEKRKLKAKIKNPLIGFSVDEQEIEFRKDPLTGRWCRININRIKRAHPGLAKDGVFSRVAVEESRLNCPFCAKNIENSTAKFVEFKERLKLGNSVLFPNLYPYSKYHAIVILSAKKHYFELNEMNKKILFDALKNSIGFFKMANEKDSKFRYPSINFNYMPPAGASIIHPHFQVFIDDVPSHSTSLLIEKSLSYYMKTGKNFWKDLVKMEKRNKKRFIGETKSFCWLADFAPRKNNEISCIIKKDVSCLTDLKQGELKDLATTLSNMFKKLQNKLFVRSLNMSIYSGPMHEDISEYFLLNLKLVSRPRLAKNYVSDIGFMEFFHGDYVAETLPEVVAKSLRYT